MTLTITTYDWVPEMPRGYVRDIRARWACEEAGLHYDVETVPLTPKTAANYARQPFGQVPALRDGDLRMFESGAIVLHLAEKSEALMPKDPAKRAQVVQWAFAALNSIEMAVTPWLMAKVFERDEAATTKASGWLNERLGQLSTYLDGRDWLVGDRFTAADLLMTEALRVVRDEDGLTDYPVLTAYLDRTTARPGFRKAHQDQLDHFEKGDRERQKATA